MGINIGPYESNFGGGEQYVNYFCCSYYKQHKITVISCKDTVTSIDITLLNTPDFSRNYREIMSGRKSKGTNAGVIKTIRELGSDINNFDLILENTGNPGVINSVIETIDKYATKKINFISINHGAPEYWVFGLSDYLAKLVNIYNTGKVRLFSNTKLTLDSWNNVIEKYHNIRPFENYIGLKIADLYGGEPLDVNTEDPNCLMVARIDRIKNYPLFNSLADKNKSIRFTAMSHSPFKEESADFKKLNLEKYENNPPVFIWNLPIKEKIEWIVKNRPITASMSITESGGLTLIESLMYGLPIIGYRNKSNQSNRYILEGKEILKTNEYLITSHGILLEHPKYIHKFEEAFKKAIDLNAFDKYEIRKYFEDNFMLNEDYLKRLL